VVDAIALCDRPIGFCVWDNHLSLITAGVEDVAKWMGANRLQLNVAKTEFLWCSSRQRLHQLPVSPVVIGGNSAQPASVVRDLGVWIDRGLSTSTHVTKVVAGCFAVLRQLNSIRRSVSRESLIGWITATLFLLDSLHTSSIGFRPQSVKHLA